MRRLMARGDINAFFGLMLDNVTNLVVLSGILHGVFGYPLDIILTRMIPGTALGVLFGDLVYTVMAYRLAKKTGRDDVTAMPLGLDTPSTVGIALTVLGPVYLETGDAMLTLYTGMGVMILMGIVKVIFSFFGGWLQRNLPRAGLLGSIGGIGIALLGFFPMMDVFKLPIIGLTSLGIIIYAFFARNRLPFRIPPVLAAVAAGTLLYYVLPTAHAATPSGVSSLGFYPPYPSLAFLDGMELALRYLPIAFPFGLLTIIGGINVNESARVAGDEYKTSSILLTEAIATLLAGLCGGVAQSTPYIGHPAYKDMGARAGYTLATALFVGLGAMLGIIGEIVRIIPVSAVSPILIFIGFEIAMQSIVTADRDLSAVLLAFIPSIANLVLIQVNTLLGAVGKSVTDLTGDIRHGVEALTVLGNGFILTAMLWGSAVSFLIHRRMRPYTWTMASIMILTMFGVIHSVNPNGAVYLPDFSTFTYAMRITCGYGMILILTLIFHRTTGGDHPSP